MVTDQPETTARLIHGKRQSKNWRMIAIPLNETAYGVLIRQQGQNIRAAFTFRGKPLNSANNKARIHALQRAEITDFRWHDLRHTWATWQRQAGTPTHELQRLGGWRTGAMVERYAHLAPDHLAVAAARLDSVKPWATIRLRCPRNENGLHCWRPLEFWWPVSESNHGHADFQSAKNSLGLRSIRTRGSLGPHG